MNVIQIRQTESDWSALVAHDDGRRVTLTYPAQPLAKRVLVDAALALAAAVDAPPELLPVLVDARSDSEEQRAALTDAIAALRGYVETHAEVFGDVSGVSDALAVAATKASTRAVADALMTEAEKLP